MPSAFTRTTYCGCTIQCTTHLDHSICISHFHQFHPHNTGHPHHSTRTTEGTQLYFSSHHKKWNVFDLWIVPASIIFCCCRWESTVPTRYFRTRAAFRQEEDDGVGISARSPDRFYPASTRRCPSSLHGSCFLPFTTTAGDLT